MNNYKYKTEQQILKKFHMKDFRNMSKDKFIKMASIIDRIDPEVAKQIVGQFPNFKELAALTLNEFSTKFREITQSDDLAFQETLKIYREQLTYLYDLLDTIKDGDNDTDTLILILDRIGMINSDIKELNTLHIKSNALKLIAFLSAGTAALAISTIFVGSNIAISKNDEDNDGYSD